MKFRVARVAQLAVALCSCCSFAPLASAAPTVFFGRDDNTALMTSFPNSQAAFNQFTATLSSFGVDNIDSAVGFAPTLAFGATGITASTQGVFAQNAPTFQIGSQALLEADAFGPPLVSTAFNFNTLITSFGLYVIQGGDAANNNPTTFRLRNTVTNAVADVPVQVGPNWGNNNVFFLGVTDTAPFNQVEILESVDGDGMLYDNVVAGGAVPEPSAVALALLGVVGGLLGLRRG